MTVRPATPADADAIARLEPDLTPDALRGTLALASTRAFVAVDADGAVLGHVIGTVAADQGEIAWVAVEPARRRGGIGRALLAALDVAWRAEGVTEAFLEVRADNAPARALYAALGWTEVGKRPRYYRDGADAVLLRRALTTA